VGNRKREEGREDRQVKKVSSQTIKGEYCKMFTFDMVELKFTGMVLYCFLCEVEPSFECS
jgi:hypothetical protein